MPKSTKPKTKSKTGTKAAIAKKPTVKKSSSRRIKQPKYKSFRVSKSIKHPRGKLPAARKLLWRSLINLYQYKKLFLGILLIYGVLTMVLVKGFGNSTNLSQLKQTLQLLSTGSTARLSTGVTLFGFLLGTSGAPSDVAAVYQSLLLIIISLTIIWALRQTQAGVKVNIRDTFYKGLYPLVPFMLVIVVIGLQTIPLVVANTLYGIVFGNGIAVTILEKILASMFFFLLAVLTIYMITSSLFAVYIVTLPDVTPMQALRSARELVRFRRWTVMRKILFLPFVVIVVGAAVVLPMIIFLTPIAEWVYFGLSMAVLVVVHSYIYTLYRELLV